MCNTTLDTLYNFINKFRESCKILESGLLIVKKEDYTYTSNGILAEIEVDIKSIKAESDDYHEDRFNDYEESVPSIINKPVTKEPIKKEQKSRKAKFQTGNRTNKIASSILEGNFSWNGDKWW